MDIWVAYPTASSVRVNADGIGWKECFLFEVREGVDGSPEFLDWELDHGMDALPPVRIATDIVERDMQLRRSVQPQEGIESWLDLFNVIGSATGYSALLTGDFLKEKPDLGRRVRPVAEILASLAEQEKRAWVRVGTVLTLAAPDWKAPAGDAPMLGQPPLP